MRDFSCDAHRRFRLSSSAHASETCLGGTYLSPKSFPRATEKSRRLSLNRIFGKLLCEIGKSCPLIASVVFKVFLKVTIFEQATENRCDGGNLHLVSGHYEAVSHHGRGYEIRRGLQYTQDCVCKRLFILSLKPQHRPKNQNRLTQLRTLALQFLSGGVQRCQFSLSLLKCFFVSLTHTVYLNNFNNTIGNILCQ